MFKARSFKEFEQAHNQDGRAFSNDGCWMYFSDGASAEMSIAGMLREPSPDLFQRAKDCLWFEKQYLEAAVKEFDAAKSEMIAATMRARMKGVPVPFNPTAAKKRLAELKAPVDEARRRVAEAEAKVEEHTPQSLINRERQREENIQRNTELLDALRAIEV